MAKETSVTVGPGFLGCLGLLFIALKLTGYINWSWWLVLLPLYGPLVLVLTVIAVILMFAAFMTILAAIFETATKK